MLPEPPTKRHAAWPQKETTMATKKRATKLTPVVVTTKRRGVFGGLLKGRPGDAVTLTQARMCTSWSLAMRGVHGLASIGPDEECRIGVAVPELRLIGVTSVATMTPEAWERWEAEPWG